MSKKISPIIDDLCSKGWSVFPNFFTNSLTQYLKEDLSHKNTAPACVGGSKTKNTEIRSDNIYWLSPDDQDESILKFNAAMKDVQEQINQELMMGLQSFESHFAEYPVGSFYKAHIDTTQKNNSRVLTFITYLNEDWKPEYGGQLRIHTNNSFVDIEPHIGTVVCFDSSKILHEVLMANKPRCAITGWFHNSSKSLY